MHYPALERDSVYRSLASAIDGRKCVVRPHLRVSDPKVDGWMESVRVLHRKRLTMDVVPNAHWLTSVAPC